MYGFFQLFYTSNGKDDFYEDRKHPHPGADHPRHIFKSMNQIDIAKLPYTLNAQQVADLLGVSRNTAYTLMHSAGFPTLHIGKRLLVPKEMLLQWMAAQLR